MVSVKFVGNSQKAYVFRVDNVSIPSLNAVRRILGYNLPIYAIDELDIFQNSSVVIDEMLANRLSLCPLTTPLISTGKKITLKLEAKGPGNIYSKEVVSSDEDVRMVYETILLTKLKEREELKLEATAVVGFGRNHVKHSPAIVSYMRDHQLELIKGCDGCKSCMDACVRNCIEFKGGKPVIKEGYVCDGCMACVDSCKKGCLAIGALESYNLTIELIGQMEISNLLLLFERFEKEEIGVLKKKIKNL